MTQFSEVLKKNNFIHVLDREEVRPNVAGGKQTVNRGRPYTFDYRFGILAAYDELGEPWVRAFTGGVPELPDEFRFFRVRQSAHVPFIYEWNEIMAEQAKLEN